MRRLHALLLLSLAASLAAPTTLAQQRGSADRLAANRTAPTEPVHRDGAIVYRVTSAFDTPDSDLSDEVCAARFNRGCTLRAAIEQANAQARGPNVQPVVIEFRIRSGPDGSEIAPGVWRIQTERARGPLPTITVPDLTIDGLTQPGARCGDLIGGRKHDLRVVLDGSLLRRDSGDDDGDRDDGLDTVPPVGKSYNENLIVQGLVIQGFPDKGMEIGQSAIGEGAGIRRVECNYIGTDYKGELNRGNDSRGVLIKGEVRNNLISGNGIVGVQVNRRDDTDGILTTISRNLIGTNADGNRRLGNGRVGILSSRNDDVVIKDNVVSANGGEHGGGGGIIVRGGEGLEITNNKVGLARNRGIGRMGNTGAGILIEPGPASGPSPIDPSTDIDIGGLRDGQGNFVGGNGGSGIVVRGGSTFDIRIRGNTIFSNTGNGISMGDSTGEITSDHIFEGNFIGTNDNGDDLGNRRAGIFCESASDVRIGQNSQPNTIRFNGTDGIFLSDGCQNIPIVGNIISDNGDLDDDLAVDLAPDGVNPNGPGDGGANDKLNYPVITSAVIDGKNTTIDWMLDAEANTTYELLFCQNAAPDDSGFGECETPDELETVTTDSSGQASGTLTPEPGAYPVGSWVTANATVVEGALPEGYRATSEFSLAVQVEDTSTPLAVTIDIEAASSEALPTETTLAGAYPNPFSRSATVGFALPSSQRVTLSVYDVLGREVARLVDGEVEAGRHEAALDGATLPSGVYLIRLTAGNVVQTKRISLVR